jgi:SAM-dependent methyltransferase
MDLVLALDVVEHLADDGGCVREMARVCRPGGHALLHVPAFQVLWSDKDELNHHHRRYRRADFIALVERSGLTVERSYFINSFLFPVALARSLGQRIAERIRPRPRGGPPPSVDHLYRIPEAVNRLMTGLMGLEWRALSAWIPFGMSFVCVATKRASRPLLPTQRRTA